jgi:hypothetical protein
MKLDIGRDVAWLAFDLGYGNSHDILEKFCNGAGPSTRPVG